MAVEVILPKVDMDMATGQISRWFFKEGDTVKQGDVLFEIETDKAAMEIDAPASGILRNITGKEGVDIPVGHAVAWIYAEGEDASAAPAAAPAAEVKSEKPESSSPESSSQDRSAQTAPAVQDTPVQAGGGRDSHAHGSLLWRLADLGLRCLGSVPPCAGRPVAQRVATRTWAGRASHRRRAERAYHRVR
ncbi:2-oxoglutarate dehydrogenase [Aquamicrobium defluvii]|uniref:2-oxoglutarate dehydrogenase n=1 Tax=Aquamicrobium defluvii TaxID=69279 RepID=A0A011SQI0_9HYPH|nr:2-oxoglutarate dehydrogenase [Aquamicrobium defluvii]